MKKFMVVRFVGKKLVCIEDIDNGDIVPEF